MGDEDWAHSLNEWTTRIPSLGRGARVVEPAKVHTVVLAERQDSAALTGVVVDKPGTYEFSIIARGVGGERKFADRVEVFIR